MLYSSQNHSRGHTSQTRLVPAFKYLLCAWWGCVSPPHPACVTVFLEVYNFSVQLTQSIFHSFKVIFSFIGTRFSSLGFSFPLVICLLFTINQEKLVWGVRTCKGKKKKHFTCSVLVCRVKGTPCNLRELLQCITSLPLLRDGFIPSVSYPERALIRYDPSVWIPLSRCSCLWHVSSFPLQGFGILQPRWTGKR